MEPQIVEVGADCRILFHVANEMVSWRVRTLREKEPETVQWIDTFRPDDLFVDIGANIGIYSLYAACLRGVDVVAFEPESLNYALLNKNIFLNKMDHKVKAYPFAISDEMAWSELHVCELQEGSSCHNFKERRNFKHEPARFRFSQGCVSISLDELVQKGFIAVPQHIKVDVDGIEHKVLKGADQLLEHPELRSVLVEINTHLPAHCEIVDLMEAKGFVYSQEQVDTSLCKEGVFEGVGNYIFFREPRSEWEKVF